VVVSAANSAARKRSRPSSSAARDSRVPDQSADGISEATMSELETDYPEIRLNDWKEYLKSRGIWSVFEDP
jgi:hypothetical protein